MTRIVDTAISIGSETPTTVFLKLGVDIHFTGGDLPAGRSGAAQFRIRCIVWDDDAAFNDFITSRTQLIKTDEVQEITGIDMEFSLSKQKLRDSETAAERFIELFGEFILTKNGKKLGPSVKTRNVNFRLPGGAPVPPFSGLGGSPGTPGSPA